MLEQISLADYQQLLQKQNLLPGRRMLHEQLELRFSALANVGLSSVAQLSAALATPKKLSALAEQTGISEEYLTLLRREIGSLTQKPVLLSDFPDCDKAHIQHLADSGICISREYWENPADRADALFALCDLVRINGVGAVAARAFYEAGLALSLMLRVQEPLTCSSVSTRSTLKRTTTRQSLAKKTCSFASTLRSCWKDMLNPNPHVCLETFGSLFSCAMNPICVITLQTPNPSIHGR
ncbi:MAG: hypothetical protein R2912_07535 [Eubacteriales bacterium]